MSRRLLPLADAGSLSAFARRTRLHWAVLAVSLIALASAAVLLSRSGRPAANVLPDSGSTVVVIDLSGSTRSASKRIASALLGLTHEEVTLRSASSSSRTPATRRCRSPRPPGRCGPG